MKEKCVIVIPVYKSLDIDEIMVVKQLLAQTTGFRKVFVAPQSFVFDESYSLFKELDIIRFNDLYFADIQGYNKLMLARCFYETFNDYEYLLIHQTDAYLFKDELEYWCGQGYDYIGAPWTNKKREGRFWWFRFTFNYCKLFINREKLVRRKTYNNVGNGGLSLRKVSTFIKVLSIVDNKLLALYNAGESSYFNEDVFWSVEVPHFYRNFNIPNQNIAMYFSLESESERLYTKMGNQLPFGCHAFKSLDPDFWKRFIPFKLS